MLIVVHGDVEMEDFSTPCTWWSILVMVEKTSLFLLLVCLIEGAEPYVYSLSSKLIHWSHISLKWSELLSKLLFWGNLSLPLPSIEATHCPITVNAILFNPNICNKKLCVLTSSCKVPISGRGQTIWSETTNPYFAFLIKCQGTRKHLPSRGVSGLCTPAVGTAAASFQTLAKRGRCHTWEATALKWETEGIRLVAGLCSPNPDLVSTWEWK